MAKCSPDRRNRGAWSSPCGALGGQARSAVLVGGRRCPRPPRIHLPLHSPLWPPPTASLLSLPAWLVPKNSRKEQDSKGRNLLHSTSFHGPSALAHAESLIPNAVRPTRTQTLGSSLEGSRNPGPGSDCHATTQRKGQGPGVGRGDSLLIAPGGTVVWTALNCPALSFLFRDKVTVTFLADKIEGLD